MSDKTCLSAEHSNILLATIEDAVTRPGWRKILLGLGANEVAFLDAWVRGQRGRAFPSSAEEVEMLLDPGQRRVLILIEPER